MKDKNIKIYFVMNIIILLILACTSVIYSQPSDNSNSADETLIETKFERIQTKLGISNTIIRALYQDNYGFMWIGTSEGLSRFDGFSFKIYNYRANDSNSIPDNYIKVIFEDKEKTLWIATNSGDLAKYDREKDKFITVSNDNSIPSDASVTTIIDDPDENLLIGTTRTGIKLFNKKENSFKDYFESNKQYDSLFPQNIVTRFMFIDESKLLFGGPYGLGIYDIKNNSILKFVHDPLNSNSLSHNYVKCIFKDSRNRCFIGTEDGLNVFNISDNTFKVHKVDTNSSAVGASSYILSITEDKNNIVWIGTVKGLHKFNNDGTFQSVKNDVNDPNGIIQNEVITYADKSNVLWIGSSGRIYKLDCERKKFHTLSKIFTSPENNFEITTSAIYIDSAGYYWIGIRFRDGIYKFTKDENGLLKFSEYSFVSKEMESSALFRIISDSSSNMWLIYYLGGYLIKYPVDKKKIDVYYLSPNRAVDMCLINNNILISVEKRRGIMNFDIKKNEFVNVVENYPSLDKLPKDNYNELYHDKENVLWIGSDSKGLFEYNFKTDILNNYISSKDDSNSLSGNDVVSISEDSQNNLWIGTGAGGISKFNKSSKHFERYGFGNGLNSIINGILEDNYGYIWLSSNDGLYKFDPVKLTARHFDETDGSLFYNYGGNVCVKDKDGTLFFGGSMGGITYFNPDEIKDNPYIPNIVLTDFYILNEPIKSSPENPFLKKDITAAKEINLSYKENVFSFEFAALIYNNPSKNQYAYQMEGFDKEWVYCGTRRNVTYTNLDPGDYTFRVKGSNNDGIWNEEGTSIKITITPPWWLTWWFKSCGASLILLTIGFGYRKRMSKLKKEKEVQEEYSRKLLASQEEERKRIANELHDSIAHDILILKNDVVSAMNATKEEETKNALNKISDQSTETLNDVRNISYNLHPHQIEALGITKAIKSIIDKSSGSSKVNFINDIENIDKIFTEENEVHIFRIIQEAISNIIKYSDSPEAIIKISCTKKSVSILISDIGKGFDIGNVEKGSLGLSGIAERVKILGGVMNIESKKGEGTVFKIDLPLKD